VENSYLMTTDYYRKCLGKPRFVEGWKPVGKPLEK
jgi:hypothetical protein